MVFFCYSLFLYLLVPPRSVLFLRLPPWKYFYRMNDAMHYTVMVQRSLRRLFLPGISFYAMNRMCPGEGRLLRYLEEVEFYDRSKPAKSATWEMTSFPPIAPVMSTARVKYTQDEESTQRLVGIFGIWFRMR